MVLINEWLPNPTGADAAGEWIELWNNGTAPVTVAGWRLTADGKKFFALQGDLNAGAYLLLQRTKTKITLKNADGTLALYDAAGKREDSASFQGTAPEGQSVNRTMTGTFFGKPTPGAVNAVARTTALAHDNAYPLGVPLAGAGTSNGSGASVGAGSAVAASAGAVSFFFSTFFVALALAALAVFILKADADVSQLFFGRN